MNIMYDSKHKKIDTRELNTNKRRKVNVTLGSIILSLTLLSGCGKTDKSVNNEVNKDLEINPKSGVSDMYEESDSIDVISEITDDVIDTTYEIGSSKEKTYDIKEYGPDDTITLPSSSIVTFTDGSYYKGTKIAFKDLEKINLVGLTLKNGADCEFLNYLPNLEILKLYQYDDKNYFDNVDGSRLPENLSIEVASYGFEDSFVFSEERYPFIKDVKNVKSLTVGRDSCSFDFSNSYLCDLDNVEEVTIYIDEFSAINNFNLNTNHLKKLNIKGKPYDIAMFITSNDLNSLNNMGISLSIDNEDEVKEIIKELDVEYESIGINDTDTSIEKMDKILVYILNKFNYDPEVRDADENGVFVDLTKFYGNGELDAALNCDTQICGNYAAMMYTLCRRAGINNYCLVSLNHAWNAVEIGDYYYYVDPTWLDGTTLLEYRADYDNAVGDCVPTKLVELTAADVIEENNRVDISRLDWYLVNPADAVSIDQDNSHVLAISPNTLVLDDIPDEVRYKDLGLVKESTTSAVDKTTSTTSTTTTTTTTEAVTDSNVNIESNDISNKVFNVTFNGKTYVVGGAALFGLLSALGVGSLVHKKRKEEEKRRKRQQLDDIFMEDDSFSRDYDNFHNSYR